jgi:uncharacterized membrane protein
MDTIPAVVPPLPRKVDWNRNLAPSMTVDWLRSAWTDFKTKPAISLAYGMVVFVVSLVLIATLFTSQRDYFLFPAIAGFMVAGPAFAIGLYEKSKKIAEGADINFSNTMPKWSHSGGQIAFIGVLLVLLVMLWIRAAVLLYALFFGLLPFEGLQSIIPTLIGTPSGIALLIVGSLVGGLFASFAFAISVFSIPILLAEDTDAFTAMGTSMALVWNNLPTMLVWAAIVLGLFLVSCLTGFIALIVVFPVLGHATWHAYEAVQHSNES